MYLKRLLSHSKPAHSPQPEIRETARQRRCSQCGGAVDGLGACGVCGHYAVLSPDDRIGQLLDPGTFVEWDRDVHSTDPLSFSDTKSYRQRLAEAEGKTGRRESVVTGEALLGGRRVVCVFFDFAFMGGTMGAATGEKIVRAFERAERKRAPVVAVSATGGARIQEGTVALAQMTRVSAAVERFHRRGLPFVAILAEPSTGGVLVSLTSQADIILSEPGAHSSFAGRRVQQPGLHEESASAEQLVERGLIDGVVCREEQASTLNTILTILTRANRVFARRMAKHQSPSSGPDGDGWESVVKARSSSRVKNEALVNGLLEDFVPLRGDRSTGNDPAMITGVGTFEGRSVALIATAGSGRGDLTSRPNASGYRQAGRVALLASKFGIPVISLIDTIGADASAESERQGLPQAIGRLFRTLTLIPVPTVAIITGEGGSGGALALGVADRLYMLESAVFSVIDPLAASRILFRDDRHAADLARSMGLSASDALRLGVIDGIISDEGNDLGDPARTAAALSEAIRHSLAESQRWLSDRLVSTRQEHIRALGAWSVADQIERQARDGEARGWNRALRPRRLRPRLTLRTAP